MRVVQLPSVGEGKKPKPVPSLAATVGARAKEAGNTFIIRKTPTSLALRAIKEFSLET